MLLLAYIGQVSKAEFLLMAESFVVGVFNKGMSWIGIIRSLDRDQVNIDYLIFQIHT